MPRRFAYQQLAYVPEMLAAPPPPPPSLDSWLPNFQPPHFDSHLAARSHLASVATGTVQPWSPFVYTLTFPFGMVDDSDTVRSPRLIQYATPLGGGAPAPPLSQLIIDGVDRSDLFSVQGASCQFQLNGVAGTMSLTLIESPGTYRALITPGRPTVHWLRFGQLFFAGYIASRDETFINPTDTNTMYQVLACTDWNIRLAERVITRDYLAPTDTQDGYGTLLSIIQAIMAEYLTPEGFALVPFIDPGVDLGDQKLTGQTVAAAFSTLATAAGWNFYVTLEKQVHFFDPLVGRGAAPFAIETDNQLFSKLVVSERMGKYRNIQWVMSTASPEALRTDTFTIPAAQPYIFTLGGTPEPRPGYVNPRILDDDEAVDIVASDGRLVTMFGDWQAGWAWALERPTSLTGWRIHWNSALGPLTPGDEITFTYPVAAQEPVLVRRENTSEIAARRAAEGGTGIIEDLVTVNGGTRAQLEAYADALLARFGPDGMMQQVKMSADHHESAHSVYQPGMLGTVSHARPLASGTFLVEQTSMQEEGGVVVRWDATLQKTGHYGNWISREAELLKALVPVQARRVEKYVFTVAETVNGLDNPGLLVGDQANTTHTVTTGGVFKAAGLHFQDDPPTGSTVIIDLLRALAATPDTFVSVLPFDGRIEYAPGVTTEQVVRKFLTLNLTVAKGDRLRWTCLQGDATAKDGVLVVEVLV